MAQPSKQAEKERRGKGLFATVKARLLALKRCAGRWCSKRWKRRTCQRMDARTGQDVVAWPAAAQHEIAGGDGVEATTTLMAYTTRIYVICSGGKEKGEQRNRVRPRQ